MRFVMVELYIAEADAERTAMFDPTSSEHSSSFVTTIL